ncbi:MAG: TIM barrel protein [Phycisphaerales bacterium]|jgi:sugar phosphate isomerase/epimerase
MLLALAARSLRSMLAGKDASLPLTDLPRFAHEQLGLHGLMLSADLLAGRTRDDLSRLRDAADRARCSCLVLLEEDPQKLAAADASAAAERIRRVMAAASLLGCNAASVAVDAPDSPEALEIVAERFKALMGEAEQRELNLLIMPGSSKRPGLTSSPDRLTELLKKIGGFRVGTMPDFAHAAEAEDPPAYLRKVTPYASAVLGSTLGFKVIEGELDDERAIVEHQGYDLAAAVEAIAAVGYDGAVGLDYHGEGDLRMGLRRSREGFALAMEGKGGPFSLVQDEEEFDDEMDAAAAALLDAILSDDGGEDDEGEDDDEGDSGDAVDRDSDDGDAAADDAAPAEPAPTKTSKKTTKKPAKKTTKKTAKKATDDGDEA